MGRHQGCTYWAPLKNNGSFEAWQETRRELNAEIFGLKGELPSRHTPDVGPEKIDEPHLFGNCRCVGLGICTPQTCAARINMTRFEWHTTVSWNNSNMTLKSVVFHTLNTSGIA